MPRQKPTNPDTTDWTPAPQHNFLTVIEQMWEQGTLPRTCGYHHCHIAHALTTGVLR